MNKKDVVFKRNAPMFFENKDGVIEKANKNQPVFYDSKTQSFFVKRTWRQKIKMFFWKRRN